MARQSGSSSITIVVVFLLSGIASLLHYSARAAGVVSPCTEASFKTALAGGGNVTFACNGTITLSSEAVVNTDTIIDGAGRSVTLSGADSTRILRLVSTAANPRSLSVRNLTLANARAAPTTALPDASRGGAIMVEHQGILVLENVTFNDNTAADGGSAVYGWYESTLTVDDCRFTGNTATAGNDERGATIAFIGPNALTVTDSEFTDNLGIVGAAINTINATLTIENTRFTGNDTLAAALDTGQPNPTLRGFGGAVYTDRGTVVIRDSVFRNNRARSAGGALALHLADQQSITLEDNIFENNQTFDLPNAASGSAGAVYLFGLEAGNLGATIERNLFAGNRAVNDSGALRIQRLAATVSNNTFFDNATTNPLTANYTGGIGGAIAIFDNDPVTITHATFAQNYASWVGGAITGNNNTTVRNSVFFQNSADNGTNNWGIQQHTSCNLGGGNNIQLPGNGNDCNNVTANTTTANPLLSALADNGGPTQTMALQAGSPAIDATASDCASVDQRGFNRATPCDLGAFEFGAGTSIFDDSFEPL